MDFLEIKSQMFVLIVDACSKRLEVFPITSTTSRATIAIVRQLFARYGLPNRAVSDNGPQFIAEDSSLPLDQRKDSTLSKAYECTLLD